MASSDADLPVPGISLVKGPGSSMYACIISDHPTIVDFVRDFGRASPITQRYLEDIVNLTTDSSNYFSRMVSKSPTYLPQSTAAPTNNVADREDLEHDGPPVDDDSLELLAFDRLATTGSAAGSASGIDPESLVSFKCVCGKQCTSSSGLSRHRKLCDSFKTTLAAPAPDSSPIDDPTPDSLPFIETAPAPVPAPVPAPDAISAA